MNRRTALGLAAAAAIAIPQLAQAADMPLKAPIMKAPPPVFTWTGCYIGGNVGGKSASHEGSLTSAAAGSGTLASAASTLAFERESVTTVIGGGQFGCNYQTGQFVLGAEIDADAQRWSETRTLTGLPIAPFVAGDSFSVRSRWQASARARLGYTWDRMLLYVTGGAAWTDMQGGVNFIPTVAGGIAFPADVFSERKTRVGATFGGGLEYAFTNAWSAGVEGRYTWYGSQSFNGGSLATVGLPGAVPTFTLAPITQSIKLNTAEAMVKLNYHFGAGF